MAPDLQDLPIFPLNTVLFPGGVLPLRVFEARNMDMTRDCLKAERPFAMDGKTYDYRNTFEVGADGRLTDRWFQNMTGSWQAGHVVEFVRSK